MRARWLRALSAPAQDSRTPAQINDHADFAPPKARLGVLWILLEFLTGKTRCNQLKFRSDCKSALSQRFFSVN